MLVGACGGDNLTPPDAGAPDAVFDPAPLFPACREFAGAGATLPLHMTGALAASDVQSPQCAEVDAPYGIESAGPDTVVALDNLVPGTAYIVRLRSPADLGFYVATGCSSIVGPTAAECPLFVDALGAGGDEVGRFVATASREYVIVDYYASANPSTQTFTLDVYAEACTTSSGCDGATPVCFQGRCVECADSFDCGNAALPRCDGASNACAAGVDSCSTSDAYEPADDGPAGAYLFSPDGSGDDSTTSEICSSPRDEVDYYAFEVTSAGETWDITLTWSGTRDLDLEVYDSGGTQLALSYWEQPESLRLTYLAIGTYYIQVSDFAQSAAAVGYSIAVHRSTGTGCTTAADCASEYRNQLYRGDCDAGACIAIAGNHAVGSGGACDSTSDCAAGLSCPSFYFTSGAETRAVCSPTCNGDTDCAGMGADYVCTTFLIQNLCVQKCVTDDQCPVDIDSPPSAGPWDRLHCQVSTGKCMP
jgi:hypothetical protein